MQASGAGLFTPGRGRCGGMGPTVVGQSRLKSWKNRKIAIFGKISFLRGKGQPMVVFYQIPMIYSAKGKISTPLIRNQFLELRILVNYN